MVTFMSAAGIISNIITILTGLLVAKWMLPEQLGYFTGFSIITSYIILAQLGIPSGLSRELPRYKGLNNEEKARQVAGTSNFYELTLAIIIIIACIILAIIHISIRKYQLAAGFFVVGFTSFQGLYVTKYLKVLYRSNNDFNKLTTIGLITTAVSAISVLFVWKFAFYGLCLRAFVVFLADYYFTWKWRPISVSPFWSKTVFRELIKVGFPIYWVANVIDLWPVVQRTFVITYMGTKAMGLYSLALMVETGMKTLTNSLSIVTFPKISFMLGQGANIREILKQPMKMVMAILILNVMIAIFASLFLPHFIKFLLPNYIEGLSAAQWMLWVGAFTVLGVFQNIYMAINKNKDRLYSFLAGILAWVVTLILLITFKGPRLDILPQSLLVAYFVIYIVDFLHYRTYARLQYSLK